MRSNKVLWGLQIFFGLFFLYSGALHFILPEGLPAAMNWMYELSDSLHIVSGVAEILGGLGLLLPGLTRIMPILTVAAAFGLSLLMVGAAIWHIGRGEPQQIVQDLIFAGVLLFLAHARWKVNPLPAK